MADKLRIGIVGATPGQGWGPRAHLPAYRALPGVELTAVCTSRLETAERAAKEWGVAEAYSDYHQLIASPNVDVVCAVTRILLHAPIARAAIEAGKPVYSEWPLGVDTAEAEGLAALAQAKGVPTMVGLQSRFAPHFARMKELIDEGYLGRLLTVHMSSMGSQALTPRPSYYAFLAKRSAGWGALTISVGHALATLSWLVGGFEKLTAQVSTQVPEWTFPDNGQKVTMEPADSVDVVLRTKSGAVGTVQSSNTAYAGSGFRLELYGTGGKLAIHTGSISEFGRGRFFGAKTGEQEHDLEVPERLYSVEGVDRGEPGYFIARLFQHHAAALREGRAPAPSFADAARLHRLLDAVQRSSDTGAWQDVSDTF